MEAVVVSDTNILIDLYEIGLIDFFFSHMIEIHTTDFVINEIKTVELRNLIEEYINSGLLRVDSIPNDKLIDVLELISGNLSITDCSVWYLSKRNNWILLTGDKNLRNKAQKDGVKVKGILFLLDVFVSEGKMNKTHAAFLLRTLQKINNRLPRKDIESRLSAWSIPDDNSDASIF